jgi:hypothetical protein
MSGFLNVALSFLLTDLTVDLRSPTKRLKWKYFTIISEPEQARESNTWMKKWKQCLGGM